jgi:hypothetical protein
MAEIEFFAVGSDNRIDIVDLEDENGDLIGGQAEVIGTLKRGDNAIEGGTVEFDYLGAAGAFRGILQNTAQLQAGKTYRLEIAIDTGAEQFTVSLTRPAQFVEI